MEEDIYKLEEEINKINLDVNTKIYNIINNIEVDGTIESYRKILKVIVEDILKK